MSLDYQAAKVSPTPNESYRVRVVDPKSLGKWDEFVAETAGSTIYHHSAWLTTLARCYWFRPVFLSLESADGDIGGILPCFLVTSSLTGRRLVSLPYTNVAGPLCRSGVDPAPLLAAALDVARRERCRYLEVRGQPGSPSLQSSQLTSTDYYGSFLLNLTDNLAGTRAKFDRRARRGIAKAVRSGVQVTFGEDRSAIQDFYHLNLFTRRKHGVPAQPLAFFEVLWENLRPCGAIEVLLATYDGIPVAGMVVLRHKDTAIYAYGASDPRYLSFSPNHALFDTAITWAIGQNLAIFDLGRTAPDNSGLVEFKRQWGAAWVPLPYYYWPQRSGFVAESESGLKHRVFTAAWRRLPPILAARIGPLLYRHLA